MLETRLWIVASLNQGPNNERRQPAGQNQRMNPDSHSPVLPPIAPTKRYRAHRERQRGRILKTARELFNAQGIDRVTIAEIVATTGVRPSTLYEYFSNKDEIVWALVEEYTSQSTSEIRERVSHVQGPALAQVEALLEAFEAELAEHPERIRFQAQFDAMYAHEWSADLLLALQARVAPDFPRSLSELVRTGIADGSLRSDLSPDLTMHSIVNAAIAAQRRFASLGNRVEVEYGQPVRDLFHEAMRIILLGLSSK
jgi:AcrR family transcriptional regulator